MRHPYAVLPKPLGHTSIIALHARAACGLQAILLCLTGCPASHVSYAPARRRAPHLYGAQDDVDPTRLHTLPPPAFWAAFERRYGAAPQLVGACDVATVPGRKALGRAHGVVLSSVQSCHREGSNREKACFAVCTASNPRYAVGMCGLCYRSWPAGAPPVRQSPCYATGCNWQ